MKNAVTKAPCFGLFLRPRALLSSKCGSRIYFNLRSRQVVDDSSFMAGLKIIIYVQGPNVSFYIYKGCFYEKKQAKLTKIRVLRARLKASEGHIWPAGSMLCIPDLGYRVCQGS